MCLKSSGGFENKPIKCSHCGKIFRIELLSPLNGEENVEYCPYCGNKIYTTNELSGDELLAQIKEAESR